MIIAKHVNLHAQEINVKQETNVKNVEYSFSSHLGYSHIFNTIAGLSNLSDKYNDKLRSGFVWDLQFEFRALRFTSGILFSTYTSNGKTDYISDKVSINSVILQLGVYVLSPEQSKVSIKMFGGIGYTMYRNNSQVFGNNRKVFKNDACGNFGLGCIYRLSSHLGLSADARFIISESDVFNVNYHENSFKVEQHLQFNQLSISIGINYIF
jgi:hypothetical protein